MRSFRAVMLGVLLAGTMTGFRVSAQASGGESEAGLAQRVGKSLLSLPDYAVFDSLGFRLQGSAVLLEGYASRPILKREAEKAVKDVAGVSNVENQIKVLPTSPFDDRIRISIFRRVYGYPSLRRYSNGAPLVDDPLAVAAGGITNDPPLGFHAIHIIVDNGHVILTGVVDSKSDADVAYIQANSAPGAFSVKNELNYPGKKPEEALTK